MNLTHPEYRPGDQSLWQGRSDSLPHERFFQNVRCLNLLESPELGQENYAILGFASDEGIARNLGRRGAGFGPTELRRQLAKLPCPPKRQLMDLGDIVCQNEQLEEAQSQFANLVSHCHRLKKKTIALGGGHEIAWAHYQGLSEHYPKLGVINFDAHYDLRPLPEDQRGNSGTPFKQIAEYCHKNHRSFDYCCLGIQPYSNTMSLKEAAKALNVCELTADAMHTMNEAWQIAFIDEFLLNHKHIYLTVCLDVFAECYAPGVSAPQPLGISPWQALKLLKYIVKSGKVVSIDVAELSPPLDENAKTARLAAMLVAEMIEVF